MLNDSQQKPKPRRQRSTHKKKTGRKTNAVQIEIKKREGREENMKISQHQQREKEKKTSCIRLAEWPDTSGQIRRTNK